MHPHVIRAAGSAEAASRAEATTRPLFRPDGAPAAPSALPTLTRPAAFGFSAAAELWAGMHLPEVSTPEQLEQLALVAQRFTPRVSVAAPDGLLLEVKGSLQLFAGVRGLRTALMSECLRLKVQPVLAFAPTALAALVAARAGKPLLVMDLAQLTGQLAPLPLAALRWPPETLARLARVGVRTIGAALRLPRAGFAQRFGATPLDMLDVLTGRTPEVRAAFEVRERFRRRCELPSELENRDWLLEALAPLFRALGTFLTSRQLGVMELECRLLHRRAPPTSCVLQLAAPAADTEHLAELLGERLQLLELPEPVRACELRADTLWPRAPEAPSLWQPGEHGGGAAGDEACGLLERLRARLGFEAVHGLRELAEHRPESAWAFTEPPPAAREPRARGRRAAGAANGAAAAASRPLIRRPLWLLPVPRPLVVREGLPRRRGPLHLVSEPERIETGWWDEGEIARDYYTAIDIHGVRLWVFRERHAPHGWFLHGVFG